MMRISGYRESSWVNNTLSIYLRKITMIRHQQQPSQTLTQVNLRIFQRSKNESFTEKGLSVTSSIKFNYHISYLPDHNISFMMKFHNASLVISHFMVG